MTTSQKVAVVLALMYTAPNEWVKTMTRFQKLIYLLQLETEHPRLFEFDEHSHGPISYELIATLDALSESELVKQISSTDRSGNESLTYALTPQGDELVETLRNEHPNFGDAPFTAAEETHEEYGDRSVEWLIRHTRERFSIPAGE